MTNDHGQFATFSYRRPLSVKSGEWVEMWGWDKRSECGTYWVNGSGRSEFESEVEAIRDAMIRLGIKIVKVG